jgi:hypothetical protein
LTALFAKQTGPSGLGIVFSALRHFTEEVFHGGTLILKISQCRRSRHKRVRLLSLPPLMLTTDFLGRQVYGPYVEVSTRKGKEKPRRTVVCLYGSGRQVRRKKMSYARWQMECHLRRELTDDETVDHRDDDTLNDILSNYELMSLGDNIRKSLRKRYCRSRREGMAAGCNPDAL